MDWRRWRPQVHVAELDVEAVTNICTLHLTPKHNLS